MEVEVVVELSFHYIAIRAHAEKLEREKSLFCAFFFKKKAFFSYIVFIVNISRQV